MSEWKEYQLGELGSFNNGVNKNKGSFGHGYPFVNLLDIFNKDRIDYIPRGLVDVNQDELNRYSLIEGDILFVRSSVKLDGVGKVCVVTKDLKNTIYSGFIIRYRQSQIVLDKLFASYYLNYSVIRHQIISKGTFSANSNINQESLKTIHIKIPSLSTQKKVGSILSTIEVVIEKTQAAIAKYKAIKHGMLNDLFTRGIDLNTGKLRPKYEDAPELYKESKLGWVPREWEVEKIGDSAFVTKLAGFEYTLYFDYSKSGPIIAVRVLNIKHGKLVLDNIHTIPKETADILPRSQLQKGDLVISYVGTVGEVAVIPENNKFHLAPNVAKISVDKKKVDPFYLNQFLNADVGQNEIIKLVSSTTQAALSMQNLREVKFLLLDLKEQKEIAKRLENIDNNIESEQTYLLKLQSIKQGLMGDLLSGRKRLRFEDEKIS